MAQGEHGVGLVKRDYLPHELGETTVDTMRQVGSHAQSVELLTNPKSQIKKALDPLSILNCDKVVRIQKPKSGEVSEW